MKTMLIVFVAMLAVALLAQIIAARLFLADVTRQEDTIHTAPPPMLRDPDDIPAIMRRFADRGLAGRDGLPRLVRLTQDVELMRGEVWSPSRARQHTAVATPAFVWLTEAPGWLVPSVRVVDSFTDGRGLLEIRLFGSIPVGRFQGPDADIGEAMRYLAEIPWVPDAILANPSITWRVIDANTVEAMLDLQPRPAIVRFRFDDAGDITEMTAPDRPAATGDTVILQDWRGLMSDYAEIGGRRIPRRVEVGYVVDGVYAPYVRGRITDYVLIE